MKTWIPIAGMLLMGLPPGASAGPGMGGCCGMGGHGGGQGRIGWLVSSVDADADGVVARSEFDQWIVRTDEDESGSIDSEELSKVIDAPGMPGHLAGRIIGERDDDEDAELGPEELDQLFRSLTTAKGRRGPGKASGGGRGCCAAG